MNEKNIRNMLLRNKYRNDGKPILKLKEIQLEMKKLIDFKIEEEIYQFESVKCCICNNNKFVKLSEKDRYGLYMPVVICRKCGLIQTNPRMTKDSYDEFYNLEYRKLYVGEEKPTEAFFRDQFKRGQKIYEFLLRNQIFNKAISDLYVFEVGTGAGGILQYFKEKGCRVKGIDIGEEYIDFGKNKYNLDLSKNTIGEIVNDEKPDIIIYSHVLEHILSIKQELHYIKKLLSDDGFLYIEVPGVKNLKNSYNSNFLRYLQNAHVYHFTLSSLSNLLKTNGFILVTGNEIIKSIFQKTNEPLKKPLIENNYEEIMLFLYRLEIFRIYYYFKHRVKKIIAAMVSFNIKKIIFIITNKFWKSNKK